MNFIRGIAWEGLLIDGRIYTIYPRTCQQNNRKFGYYWYTEDMANLRISRFYPITGRIGAGFAYDDAHNCFLMMPTSGSVMKRFKDNNGIPFNPQNVGDKACVFMGGTV